MTNLSPWLLVLAGVLLGTLVGGLGALIALRRDEDGVSPRTLRNELDAYRDEVAQHYTETAKRVDALTQAYKSVYDHLEEGAVRLVGEQELRQRLDDSSSQSQPVTLEGIGRRVLEDGEPSNDRAAGSDSETLPDTRVGDEA